MNSTRRLFAQAVLVAVAASVLAAGVVPLLLAWDELPSRVATHFGLNGRADGSMSRAMSAATTVPPLVACALVLVLVSVLRRPGRPAGPYVAALAAGAGSVLASASWLTARSNQGHTDWREARMSLGWSIVVIGSSLVLAPIAAWGSAQITEPRVSTAQPPTVLPSLVLPAGHRTAWVQHSSNAFLLVPSIGVALLGGVLALVLTPWIGLVLAVLAIVTSFLAWITVRADDRGLGIAYGPLGWPRQRIALDRIEQATPIDVRPSQWGGWGYRGSLRFFRQAAVVLKAGPGIRLDLKGGKVFVVTTPDAETAAALLNSGLDAIALRSSWYRSKRRCPGTWWAPPPSKRLGRAIPVRRVRFPSTSAITALVHGCARSNRAILVTDWSQDFASTFVTTSPPVSTQSLPARSRSAAC
jgi:hypothetical protein